MKEKGFTLIELLAVIVILAIIALIATPLVLKIINNTKRSATIRSGEFYLSAVEQAIAAEMLSDSNFKAKECEVKDDGNLLCSELGFNTCEVRNAEIVCSGNEKEIKVNVRGEKSSEGIIELNNGRVEDCKFTISNNSLVMKENTLVFENDTEVIYEADSINLDNPTFNIAHLVDYNTIYRVSLNYPKENIELEQRGMLFNEDGVSYLLLEGIGGVLISDTGSDTSNNVEASVKIEKTNQKVEKYGVRIGPKRFLMISNEFVPGEAIVSIKDENDEFLYSNIVEFEKSAGNYVEVDKYLSDSTAYNNLKENKKVTVIITQNVNNNLVIRQYGNTPPKYQKEHAYSLAVDSYYWGTDFFPFSGE